MKILNRKRADNKKLGKTLSSTEEDLWSNYEMLNNAIPETSAVNPSGYDQEELQSNFDVVDLKGYPFDNLKPARGIPLQVYVPWGATTGAAAGKEGLNKLMQDQKKGTLYAIDKYWLHLQKRDRWFLIIPLTVIQKEGYSDIENKTVNYTRLMTNVNKAFFTDASKFSMKTIMNK